MPTYTPIIIGVGDVKNKSTKLEDAVEPAQLMLEAAEIAIRDMELPHGAEQSLRSNIDSIDCVATWTWPYPDLPGLLAQKLNVKPRHSFCSDHGGNQPAKLLDDAARRISRGDTKVAMITGGEALASLSACAAAGKLPPPGWSETEVGVNSVFTPSLARMAKSENLGTIHQVGMPIQVYPMYENGYRAANNQSFDENHNESTQLYEQFAAVAAQNPNAWSYGTPPATRETIGKVTKKNRMICTPYPLLMNAFNTVNLAATCIITSTEYAEKLGIPKHKWIHVLGGAGTKESEDFWQRLCYHQSPAISRSIDAALDSSRLAARDIDLFDFYSCFPIVPKLACKHLGLSTTHPEKPITLLGGLTSFGGAGNNYSMHAITEMTRQLRNGNGSNGLILANGGCLTYQHVICLSSSPRSSTHIYSEKPPLRETTDDIPICQIEDVAYGEANVETYTVDFGRDGKLSLGHIVGRLKSNGRRFVANHADEGTLSQLASTSYEPIGRTGWVRNESSSGCNLFSFERTSRL